jgi:hypothetical protein
MSCGGGHLEFSIGIKKKETLQRTGKNVSKRFFSETTWTIETKLPRNDHWKVLCKVSFFFMPIENSRWPPRRHFEFHIRTKNVKFVEDHPMNIHVQFGFNNICSRFFSETTWTIESKLPRNDHWKVLYKFSFFFMPIENSRWPPPQDID